MVKSYGIAAAMLGMASLVACQDDGESVGLTEAAQACDNGGATGEGGTTADYSSPCGEGGTSAEGGATAEGGSSSCGEGGTTAVGGATATTPELRCETAFAKGNWVWTTDPRSLPDDVEGSLMLTRNRWGWAINLESPGCTEYPIYAGAAHNDTEHRTPVGTLTVCWDGEQARVDYVVIDACILDEVHLYASDDKPIKIAPGQFTYAEEDLDEGAFSFGWFPLADVCSQPQCDCDDPCTQNECDPDGVWLIAHAVVCCEAEEKDRDHETDDHDYDR